MLFSPDAGRVEAVLSWKCSVRGDFLYDAARHHWYQLHIGFIHLGWNLWTGTRPISPPLGASPRSSSAARYLPSPLQQARSPRKVQRADRTPEAASLINPGGRSLLVAALVSPLSGARLDPAAAFVPQMAG